MIRKAFTLRLNPGQVAEYARRHQPIWPELATVLHEHGVSNYSIFLDEETHLLFGYAEITSETQWQAIASTPVCQRWWKYMADIMATAEDNSPLSQNLTEVFHLD